MFLWNNAELMCICSAFLLHFYSKSRINLEATLMMFALMSRSCLPIIRRALNRWQFLPSTAAVLSQPSMSLSDSPPPSFWSDRHDECCFVSDLLLAEFCLTQLHDKVLSHFKKCLFHIFSCISCFVCLCQNVLLMFPCQCA